MVDALIGSWNFDSTENIEAFLAVFESIPEEKKKAAAGAKPSAEVSKDGNTWTIKTIRGDGVFEVAYTEGQEIDTKNFFGGDCKSTLTVEGETLVEVQKAGDKQIKITRSIENNQYVVTFLAKGVEMKAKFNKA